MNLLLILGVLGAFPCDGATLRLNNWPLAVDVLDLISCQEEMTQGNCPVADAGREQFVTVGNTVLLDGARSTGPAGSLNLNWEQVANGAPVVALMAATTTMPSFQPTLAGIYEFDLVASQSCLADRDRVRVVVSDQIDPPQTLNFSFIANSGSLTGGPSAFTPAQVQQPPGQPQRLYILTLEGRIWIRDNGTFLAQPYIDVSTLLGNCFECNLMSMAFHPGFAQNGIVYIKYVGTLLDGSGSNTDVRVAGFAPGLNPDVLGLADGADVLTIPQPTNIHAGGTIAFGRDDHLYIGTGDSGPQEDPNGNAQNPMLPLGKVLRYQVNDLNPVSIPATNPFVDDAGVLDQIYAIGVRNPWRITFDREGGDLFIGDNGQNQVEEVSLLSGEGVGGQNLGWNTMEGSMCFNPPVGCDSNGLEPPIFDYLHSGGGCSVIGGYVYRGPALPSFNGYYLYGDWCQGQLYLLRFEAGQWVNRAVSTSGAPGLAGTALVGFGEDLAGEIYMCTGGNVYQLTGISL